MIQILIYIYNIRPIDFIPSSMSSMVHHSHPRNLNTLALFAPRRRAWNGVIPMISRRR